MSSAPEKDKENGIKTPSPSVSSSSPTSQQRPSRPVPQQKKQPHPGKIKISKKEFLTHLSIFGIFAVMGIIKFVLETRNPASVQEKKAREAQGQKMSLVERVEKMHKLVSSVVLEPSIPTEEEQQLHRSIGSSSGGTNGLGCNLYLAESSIPGGGFGIFTVTDYKVGDVIIPSSPDLTLDTNNDALDISPFLFNMKPHYLLHNIVKGSTKNDDENGVVVTSKPINAGEELFFDMEQMMRNTPNQRKLYETLNPLTPTSRTTYDKVDEITKDVMDSIPKKERQQMKRGGSRYGPNRNPIIMEPTIPSTAILQLTQRTIERYDPQVASAMITEDKAAKSMMNEERGEEGDLGGIRATYISNKRSVQWVKENGVCIDGVYPDTSRIIGGGLGAFASRDVKKGDVVVTAPILVVRDNDDEEINSSSSSLKKHCFGNEDENNDLDVLFCPLSFARFVNHGKSDSNLSSCDATKEQCEDDGSQYSVNAFYQWSKFNKLTDQLNQIPKSDLFKKHATGLTIDIIATRDIKHGEEVLVDYQWKKDPSDEMFFTLGETMVPPQWK